MPTSEQAVGNHATCSVVRGVALTVFYLLIAAAAMGVNPFRGQTVTPFDLLISQQGWHAIDPGVEVRNFDRSDALDSLLPAWIEARLQVRSGHLPYWNPQIAGGGQAFPNLVNGLLTPDFAIFAATPDPALGFYLLTLFNLAVAGLGMHLFLRRKLGTLAAFAGGVSFALCGFITAWLYWPHVRTIMWLPWLLLAVDACVRRPRMRSALAVAVATALVVLGGFPFVGMLALEVAGVYLLVAAAFGWRQGTSPWRCVGWYAGGSAFGFLLCALPMLAFVGWLHHFDIAYRSTGSFLHLHDARLLLGPWAYPEKLIEAVMYTGSAFAVLAACALVGVIVAWRRNTAYSIFAAIVLVASAGLVFSVWPVWLVEKLPGMAHNQWGRAISILDTGLVLMAALALDVAWKTVRAWRWHWVAQAVLIAVVVGQIVDVGSFFRTFNGPVPARFYYPRTGAITYLQRHTGPFDYVVADKSYLISGTLGAYGLREWFAHAFRTPALMHALLSMADRPFNTATASRMDASQIRLNSPAMATYNVRFVALATGSGPYALAPSQPASPQTFPLPPMPANHWVQQFALTSPQQLTGIAVRLATYQQSGLHGVLHLQMTAAGDATVASAALAAQRVADNQWVTFDFAEPVALKPGRYAFTIAYVPADGDTRAITAWAIKDAKPAQPLLVNDQPGGGTVEYRLLRSPPAGAAFTRVFSDGSVDIYANQQSSDGPYFVPTLRDVPHAASGRSVRVVHYRPDRFTLRYDGRAAGFVVVPMAMARGWHVTSNGKTVKHVALKAGMMPAIAVDGPSDVTFRYRPPVLRWLYPWLAVLLVWLVGMGIADRRLACDGRPRDG